MQLYKVKLLEGHSAKREQIYGEYLGYEGELAIYSRSEAMKKAKMFGGKIEPHGKNYTATKMSILVLSRKEFSPELRIELAGREAFTDADDSNNEALYIADVFDSILGEDAERPLSERMSFDTAREVEILRELTAQVSYIMLVD